MRNEMKVYPTNQTPQKMIGEFAEDIDHWPMAKLA